MRFFDVIYLTSIKGKASEREIELMKFVASKMQLKLEIEESGERSKVLDEVQVSQEVEQ